MIDPTSYEILKKSIKSCIDDDREILERMRIDVRPLRSNTRRIHPRSATAISLVGTDGGDNSVRYDPFWVELIRVVDSSQNEYCLEAITTNTKIEGLNSYHLENNGKGRTALGRMMEYLGVKGLHQLSPVFNLNPKKRSASWVKVYREMTEWAVLLSLVRDTDFGTDTVIVRDGFLRSKMFSEGLFKTYRSGLEEEIKKKFENKRRRIYIVGIAKHSKVIQAYRLAMALEGIMRNTYPCYVEVPRELEENVYKWPEYAGKGEEGKIFVAGKMFLVKFGDRLHDPIWAIDLLISQINDASTVFGYLLNDSIDGFPVPFYPQCLQKAHENAALIDFDMDLLQDEICKSLASNLGEKKWLIEELSLQEMDPSRERYS